LLGVVHAVGFTLGGLVAGEGSFVIDLLSRKFETAARACDFVSC
jgi:hypothetical protein